MSAIYAAYPRYASQPADAVKLLLCINLALPCFMLWTCSNMRRHLEFSHAQFFRVVQCLICRRLVYAGQYVHADGAFNTSGYWSPVLVLYRSYSALCQFVGSVFH